MIVDDQAIIREGLRMMLSLCEDINIVAEASNGKEALEIVNEKDIDVILMDIRMPVMNGVEAADSIKKIYPNVKILILTTFKEDEYVFEALKNGADGYILKDIKSDEIIKGIKTVYEGNMLLQPEITVKVVKALNNLKNNMDKTNEDGRWVQNTRIEGKYEELTLRESEIAKLVAEGKSNKEISKMLFITEGTVKNHLSRVLAKLQLRDRTQLALFIKEKNYK